MDHRKLLKSFFSFSIGNWLGIIVGIISTPILTRVLTPDQLGKASMFTLALNILMLFIIFGTDQAFVRFFYEEKEKSRNKLLFNVLKIPLLIYLITSIVMIILSDRFSIFLFEEINSKLIYVLIIALFFNLLKRYSLLVIRMQQRGLTFSLLNLFLKLISLLFLLVFFKLLGNKYEIRVYSQIVAIAIVAITAVILGKKTWGFFNLKDIKLKNNMKDIFLYSYPLLFTALITWLFQSFDKIAIRQWSTYNQLGLYTAAYKIVAILNIIKNSFTTFWTPTKLEKYHEDKDNTSFFKNIYKMIFLAMMIIGVCTIMFKEAIIYLLGSDYKTASIIMPFLVFMPIMYTISETTVIGISFKKKPKWHILIAVVSCIVNIVGNYILVPHLGAKGAAISTGLSYIVFFTMRTLISLRFYKVNYNLKKSFLLIFLLVLYALHSTFIEYSYINSILGLLLLIILVSSNYKFVKKVGLKILNK